MGMTGTEITLPHPVTSPGRVGQATAVEQSRAVAEVYAAVMIARDNPRDTQAAIRAMEQACQTPELADRAFYTQKRSTGTVTDASIHLARELASCWGNIQSAVHELRRDDEYGQSEMQAVAWDLEKNNRVAMGFVQPHARDKEGGVQKLTSLTSIYESNANAGARRLRQCIFAVLPGWYVERAKALCRKTLNDGGGKPLPQRIAEALRLFEDEFGIDRDAICRKLGKPTSAWTPIDLGQLRVTYASLQQGTLTPQDAFPPATLGRDDITDGPAAPPRQLRQPDAQPPQPEPAEPEPADPGPADPEAPEPGAAADSDTPPADPARAPAELITKLKDQLKNMGITDPAEYLYVLEQVTGRRLRSTSDITVAEGQTAAELFNRAGHQDDPARALDQLLAELADERANRS